MLEDRFEEPAIGERSATRVRGSVATPAYDIETARSATGSARDRKTNESSYVAVRGDSCR